MEQIKAFRDKIIKTAPSYTKYDKNSTTTSNMLYSRERIGFSKLLYPFSHVEGASKMFDRRFYTRIYKTFPYFGPRGELLWIFGVLFLAKCITKNNLERENIDKHFVDRNVFYTLNYKPSLDNNTKN